MLRYQMPAYSPATIQALAAGFRAMLSSEPARRRLAECLGGEYRARSVALVDSGTTGLAVSMNWARMQSRGPVAVPAYGCYDLATACDSANVPVVLYDMDPRTLGPCWDSLGRVVKHGVSAIVVAHWYGVPVDMAEARAVARRAGAALIEDAAQGAGAGWQDLPVGSHGDFGVLSFGRGKGITGGGGGAVLVCGSVPAGPAPGRGRPGIGSWCKVAAQWALGRPATYAVPSMLPFLALGQTVYRPPREARGIAGSAAAVVLRTRELLPPEVAVRRANAERLRAAAPAEIKVPSAPVGGQASWLRLPMVLPGPGTTYLTRGVRALGIAGGYPLTLADLKGFRDRVVNNRDRFTGARELSTRLVTLPTHSRLTQSDLVALERWLARLASTQSRSAQVMFVDGDSQACGIRT